MRAGTGCLLRNINDLSNETKPVLFTYYYSAQAENAEENWNLTGEVNRAPWCPVFRPRFWSAGQSLQAAQTTSHICRENIYLELERLKQRGSHCHRDEELHCLMYGQEAVIWWVLILLSFSNISFSKPKNDLVLMLCLYMLHEIQQKNKNPHLGHGMIWRLIQLWLEKAAGLISKWKEHCWLIWW